MKGFVNLTHTNNKRIKDTEQEISSIFDGAKVVKKAQQDEDGLNIKQNYAKTIDLNGLKLDLTYNGTNGHLTVNLLDKESNQISSSYVDLPLEQIITNGEYDSTTQSIKLTLATGQIISVFVGDLINAYKADEETITLDGSTFKLKESFKNNLVTQTQLRDAINSAITTALGGDY